MRAGKELIVVIDPGLTRISHVNNSTEKPRNMVLNLIDVYNTHILSKPYARSAIDSKDSESQGLTLKPQ